MNKKECSVEVCDRKAQAKGLCSAHYQYKQKFGVEPTHAVRSRRGKMTTPMECIEEGCQKPVKSKDRCVYHYSGYRGAQLGQCSMENCENIQYTKTWCRTHYARYLATGSPELHRETTRPDCEVCGREAFASGKCRNHYQRWYYTEAWRELPVDPMQFQATSYEAAHFNCKRVYGPARYYECTAVGCNQDADDWALMHDAETITDEKERTYGIYVSDYTPMCMRCHRNYDFENGVRVVRELRLVDNPKPAARGMGTEARLKGEKFDAALQDLKDGFKLEEIEAKYGFKGSAMSRAFKRETGMGLQEWKHMQKESVAA